MCTIDTYCRFVMIYDSFKSISAYTKGRLKSVSAHGPEECIDLLVWASGELIPFAVFKAIRETKSSSNNNNNNDNIYFHNFQHPMCCWKKFLFFDYIIHVEVLVIFERFGIFEWGV